MSLFNSRVKYFIILMSYSILKPRLWLKAANNSDPGMVLIKSSNKFWPREGSD